MRHRLLAPSSVQKPGMKRPSTRKPFVSACFRINAPSAMVSIKLSEMSGSTAGQP